jgi:dihydrolipoamide dehydrogenase
VSRRLAELGVEVLTGATVVGDDGSRVTIRQAGVERAIDCDVVAVVAGRVPNTDDLGLDVLGVAIDERGLLPVGPDLLVAPRVAAIGDITPGPALAHRASAQAHVAAHVLSGHSESFAPLAVPAVVFSDPEIAITGYTVEEAQAAGLTVATAVFPLAASGRARTLGQPVGSATLVHTANGVVVGAQLVGPHVSELVGEITLAIELGATLEDVAAVIHPHPTMSESLVEAAAVGLGLPVHVVAKRKSATSAGS